MQTESNQIDQRTRYPGIYKRDLANGQSRYTAVWRHRGRQQKKTFRTLAEAREAKGRDYTGDRRPTTRMTVEEYAETWIENYRGRTSRGFDERTRRDYGSSLTRHAIPKLGRLRLVDMDPQDIRGYVSYLESQGLALATVRQHVAVVKAMLATAVEDGKLRSNPAYGVRITIESSDPHETARALTRAQVADFLAACPEQHRLIFEFLAHTGLRISECLALRWNDVRLSKNPAVTVNWSMRRDGKTRKRPKSRYGRRTIPLSTGMAWQLTERRHDSAHSTDEDYVFVTNVGTAMRSENLRHRVLTPAAKMVGLDWIGFHTFRHTCASILFESGKNPKQVQRWLGHHSASFTLDTYVHLLDEGLGDVEFLDRQVGFGNSVVTQHPETAENGGHFPSAKSADLQEIPD